MKEKKSGFDKKEEKLLDRRKALIKAGKYALFTAAGSMLLLSPRKAVASSFPTDPGWGHHNNQPESAVPSCGNGGTSVEPPAGNKDLA